ncbi:MAG: GNAT family N-acetyltransferase [Chloroflexota bacterium]|nr:GNAT family N-acetyltransferase [Chloroflexota bacterium]
MDSHNLTSGSRVEIVPATWRDMPALQRLEKVCFTEDSWPIWDILGVLSFPGVVRLKAVVDGQLVGFIAGDERRSSHLAWIVTLGVLPPYRRQGIGRALLIECEAQVSIPAIRLSVRRSNEAALRLYKEFGYQQIDVWANYYVGKEDALVLEKKREGTG